MTAAFFVTLAVAVISLAALALSVRSRAAVLRQERTAAASRSAELSDALRQAEENRRALEEARAAAEESRAESEAAGAAADEADRRRVEAERRAETFQAEILRAEAAAADRRVSTAATPGPGAVLWQLERLRCEREWSEVVGPGVALPVEWDETLGAVLATEMAIVREVIGTPGEVEASSPVPLSDLPQAAATVRLGVELVRTLARSGEEMVVSVSPESVTVDQRVLGPAAPGGLDHLQAVARTAGWGITVEGGDQRLLARLDLPLPAPGPHRPAS